MSRSVTGIPNAIMSRRSLHFPITLGVVMIVLLVALTVGWILLTVFGMLGDEKRSGLFFTLLSLGTLCLLLVLLGTVIYLALTVKAINLNRRQSNFIDSVTHELKSPIASLKLYLQTLHRRSVSEDERSGFYEYMLDDVERLDHLINHLLEAARLEKEIGDQELEAVDLSELLRECAHTVCIRYRVPEETVKLKLEPCIVETRRVDVDMVFRNLIDNALKYAGTPPDVCVSLHVSSTGKAHVQVSDNGSGIPRQWRNKIFRRFVRVGSELEREKSGTGLGLYIVRTLIRRHKGRISVRDRSSGGTIFDVELPNARPAGPSADNADSAAGGQASQELKKAV